MPDDRTRRWQRTARYETASDTIQVLRLSIAEVRHAPKDPEARRRLRAIAAEHGLWEELAVLLGDEARAAANHAERAAAFYEELADVYENLDQPLETIAAMEHVVALDPDDVDRLDRLAWLYRRAGGWAKAAETFERVGQLAHDDRARAALRAAGKLYRDNGRLDRAVAIYRVIVARRPSDAEAWRALEDLLTELGRWREVADVRGQHADRAASGVDKAALLRSQARALEQAGAPQEAAVLVAQASRHAPENLSGLVDYAEVLARGGQGLEAADILRARVREALDRDVPTEDVAALRLRLAGILEESCQDRPAASAVLEELLADAPGYLPALERITATAATDPDPRVHAAALLRYAAALPGEADRSSYVAAAARRSREAGDHRAAVRAFEQATELAPDDDELRTELDVARTDLAVERARHEANEGDVAAAERRLRGLLTSQPRSLGVHLALAEILAAAGKLDAAAEHLRETLATAPETTRGDQLAPLVHRFGIIMAALGDADQSHTLLHEAHRLDRRSLPITLALGESCFARKLWRQASLHLGSLADHPDASRHAPAVALGLVHAAQAEARALRPANALAHHEAAVRIDPRCAPAWHALAEVALERGDLERAADCLEREAAATTPPKDRLRLYDALGDMAASVLGDPARAERCFLQIADAGSAPVLEKLLALLRGRGATTERGEACLHLAAISEPREAKALAEEAARALVAGGQIARASTVTAELMTKYPRDVDVVVTATEVAAAAGDTARIAGWLRPTLSAWEAAGDRGDGDPRRAELWRHLGDAERDLGNEHAALEAFRKAVLAAPDSEGAHAARRGLVELASTTGRPQDSALIALVEAAQDPFDVIAWARNLARTDAAEDARAAYELALALGARLTKDDEAFLARTPPRILASDESYAAPLDEADRRELIDDPDDAPLGDLMELLAEAMAIVAPSASTALVDADVLDAKRLPATSTAATAALYPQLVKALGGPPTLLHASARASRDVTLVYAHPPVVVIGPRLAAVRAGSRSDLDLAGDAALRYELGRIVELSRPRRIFAAGTDPASFARLVAGLRHAFGPATETPVEREVVVEAERLRSRLSVVLRQRMTEWLAGREPFDPDAYLAACHRAADRAGLLVCGDVTVAVSLAGGPAIAPHLVKLASSQRYLAARKKLRARD